MRAGHEAQREMFEDPPVFSSCEQHARSTGFPRRPAPV
ncbi:hypothetical protein GGE06_001353 [Streptomyces sp. SFB5A]|uniref:Uncharacterized protein n=1 Tax=Streptomyces nymphaeiformis TaxID=2663842 RepID=A0A7W7TYT8_9ACTN|nr:hypothetical protein [Streptomyces nymphaeiformis]